MHVDTEVHSQLNLISGENTANRPCVYGFMALAYFDPVIESCKAAWQLKLTLYNAAPYGPKSGTNNYLDFGNKG